MHRHVIWALCDVSVVQSNLYFCLFGWGHSTLKIVPMYAHLNLALLFKKGRGQGRVTCTSMSCGLCVMSE